MKVLNDSKRMRLDRIQSIFKMHEQGFGNRQIAAKCFCSASTVSETLNKYRDSSDIIKLCSDLPNKCRIHDFRLASARLYLQSLC